MKEDALMCSIFSVETELEVTLYLRVLSISEQIASRCALGTFLSESNELLV